MIFIIHKMLALLKNHLNYLKDNISECLFKKYNIILSFSNRISYYIMIENLRPEEEDINIEISK